MNKNPFESGTSLFGALPFALLLLLGIIAVFGPRKLKALQLAARDRSREWARSNYPVVRRAAARIPAQAREWTPVVTRAAAQLPAHTRQWARKSYPVVKRRAAGELAALRSHIQRVAAKARQGLPKE
jgi:hypothetical protein